MSLFVFADIMLMFVCADLLTGSLLVLCFCWWPRPARFIVMLWVHFGHSEDEVIKDENFAKYTKMGRGLENYFATTHPSQPNYISITAGDYFGHNSDSNVDLDETNVVDLLEAKDLTWRGFVCSRCRIVDGFRTAAWIHIAAPVSSMLM